MKTALAVALVAAWTLTVYLAGYNVRDAKARNEALAIQTAAQQAYNTLELRYNAASASLEKHLLEEKLNVREPITKEVVRVVERPVYRHDCFDDDGLRLANSALLNRAFTAPAATGAVPATVATGR